MEWIRATFECRSPYLFPGRNCTLWGRLCWIVAEGGLDGVSLDDWFQSYESGEPYVVVGDLLPYGEMPTPALYRAAAGLEDVPKSYPLSDWENAIRAGRLSGTKNGQDLAVVAVERTHVSLSRSKGSAAEGALYTAEGWYSPGGMVLYALAHEGIGAPGVQKLLEALCEEGWGLRRNVGYGQLKLISCEPMESPKFEGNDLFVTLGHIHPTEDLPAEGWWRWTGVPVIPHDPDSRRAMIDPEREDNHPLSRYHFTTMLQPGATFRGAPQQPFAGAVLKYQAGNRTLYHYGMSPVLPIAEPKSDGGAA